MFCCWVPVIKYARSPSITSSVAGQWTRVRTRTGANTNTFGSTSYWVAFCQLELELQGANKSRENGRDDDHSYPTRGISAATRSIRAV